MRILLSTFEQYLVMFPSSHKAFNTARPMFFLSFLISHATSILKTRWMSDKRPQCSCSARRAHAARRAHSCGRRRAPCRLESTKTEKAKQTKKTKGILKKEDTNGKGTPASLELVGFTRYGPGEAMARLQEVRAMASDCRGDPERWRGTSD